MQAGCHSNCRALYTAFGACDAIAVTQQQQQQQRPDDDIIAVWPCVTVMVRSLLTRPG